MKKTGFTLLELIVAISILALLTSGTWLALRGFLVGRSVESTAENLINLISSAQVSAKETESCQMILLTETSATWIRYPGKTKDVVAQFTGQLEGEIVRSQEFKNEVKIEELELESGSVAVPDESVANIGILIDERGNADSASIVLAKGEETAHVSVGGQIATSGGGSLGVLESGLVIPANAGIQSNEEALIVQTEPLQARGWQVITVNNVDKVKEVKLRIKLDPKLPASAHLHAYVFPGWYENKPVAHGITGEQTMLNRCPDNICSCHIYGAYLPDKSGKYIKKEYNPLYRESTQDCMAFFTDDYTVSGTLTNELGIPISGMKIMEPYSYQETYSNKNGFYNFILETLLCALVYPSREDTLNGFTYNSIPNAYPYPPGTTLNQTANLMMYRNTQFPINGFVGTNNGTPISDVMINIDHVPIDFTNYGITIAPDSGTNIHNIKTEENGSYNYNVSADHFYSIKPVKQGYVFIPESATLFLDNNKTQNFIGTAASIGNPFSDNKPPLGNWNYTESQIVGAAISTSVPVFGNAIGYYIYKDKVETIPQPFRYQNATQTLPMLDSIQLEGSLGIAQLISEQMPNNALNPGALSDFATKQANLVYENTVNYDNAHWEKGFVQSSFASQSQHIINTTNKETRSGEYSEWITIQVSSLPVQTKFLRIAIAVYHNESSVGELSGNGEQLFNLYPTNSSTHSNNTAISFSQLDYQTDPFIIYHPWHNWINDPFWLSNYAYALKPILRPYGVNVLANKGPITGENYRNTGNSYKGFWYGAVYLDWDLILGNENIYWLIGWTSGAFELTSNRWRFTQQGDTYGNIAFAPPSHYLLKNFAYLSYWYLFQHSAYSEQPSYNLPKRFQEPLNLVRTGGRTGVSPVINGWLKLFEIPDPVPYLVPWESSSLSIPFQVDTMYPMWLPSLPSMFGQQKIVSAPDLYSSFYYLQERINHTMLDMGIWAAISNETTEDQKGIIFDNIFSPLNCRLSNFERLSFAGGDTLSCWWEWYQAIPWTKGQAFPKKTGILPTDISARTGWETPVITQPSSYWDYFNSTLIFNNNPTTSYNATQVVNAPHTIFMSTAHYPLGSIQIKVKKK